MPKQHENTVIFTHISCNFNNSPLEQKNQYIYIYPFTPDNL